jgi:hypothetical protein
MDVRSELNCLEVRMKVEDVEKLVSQLPAKDQLRIAAGICQQLSTAPAPDASQNEDRRERMVAAIRHCDEIARSIVGDFDSAEDIRRLRAKRTTDLDGTVR